MERVPWADESLCHVWVHDPDDHFWGGRGRGRRLEFLSLCRGRGIARLPRESGTQTGLPALCIATEPSSSDGPSRGMGVGPSSQMRSGSDRPASRRRAARLDEIERYGCREEWRARSATPAMTVRPSPTVVGGAATAAERPAGNTLWARPPVIIDKKGAVRWLQQAEAELVGARRMLVENDEHLRALPAAAVWHCQQAVEMGLKSAMLCTNGLTEEEFTGRASHNLAVFERSFRQAQAITGEPRRAHQVPATRDDLEWLRRAYLAARYPNASSARLPVDSYTHSDAQHAITIAEDVLFWAAYLVDRARAADAEPQPGPT